MDKGIEALIARKGNAVTGNYYLAECGNCSEMFPSERMTGGEALYAGDYGDCYCPHCGAADCDISDYGDILSNAGLAWNYQQKHIDALIAALEQAQQECQSIEQKLIKAAVYIETLESEPRKTNLKLLNEIAGLKRKCAELEDRTLSFKLPDPSSKAFWGGSGKNETFYPSTYKVWVADAIERAGVIAGIKVEVK